jgi:mono/diheme cytochrome c family protein
MNAAGPPDDIDSTGAAAVRTPAYGTVDERRKRWWIAIAALVVVLLAGAAWFGWYKFFREEPQEDWVMQDADTRFKYGSIGAENDAGLPYWIFYVLPRMFPEKLPGPGGYASLGVPWEEGRELPVGFTKKVVGFARVANNCAVCHSTRFRTREGETPTIVAAGPGTTTNVEGFFRFFVDCAKDPRFTGDNVLWEIMNVADLSWIDKVIYRFVLIPITKKRLLEREQQFAWVYHAAFPEWGRGRDDAMNLTKYFMLKLPMDDSFGPTDMPSIWNLRKYDRASSRMNWAGDSHDAYSVIIDSALGLVGSDSGPKDKEAFLQQIDWLRDYLRNKPPPKYPFPIDAAKAAAGKALFDAQCAACHASERTGTPIPLVEVGTNRDRIDTWGKDFAVASNKVVRGMGFERKGLVEAPLIGYTAQYLDGIWLRAPYLHNGSVPTLRDLLEPPPSRPRLFYRGYDLYDPQRVGFVATGAEAAKSGTKFDVSQRGNGNEGHDFGTSLPASQKDELVEYLKTL